MNLSPLASDVAKNLNRHAPAILTGVSIVGMVATAYLFHQAGVKSTRRIVQEEAERVIPMSLDEKIQMNWYDYLIPTSIGVATVVCLISTNVLNARRQATLVGAYALAQQTFSRYRDKIAEQFGEGPEELLREDIVRDVARETKPEPSVLDQPGMIFLDVFSGQQFISDERTVRQAMDDTNAKCEEDGFATLNYFYDRIGARTTQLGELMGWSDGIPLEVILSPVVFEDGTQGFGLDYARMPFMGYHEV